VLSVWATEMGVLEVIRVLNDLSEIH
jgi:hypothetical protein